MIEGNEFSNETTVNKKKKKKQPKRKEKKEIIFKWLCSPSRAAEIDVIKN